MKCELMVPAMPPLAVAKQYGKISERASPPDKESGKSHHGIEVRA